MKIAIEGCAHGELEIIYNTIQEIETEQKTKIDLLICCGDFQSSRNEEDLKCMAVPEKYHKICSFYKYYTGEKQAPILTVFIGGNHEASNYLQELPYGGWVAPNIYYLGYAGVINIGGIRIGGLSGIYKSRDYMKGHFERAPYDDNSKRSVYHIRNLEVFRLKQLSGEMDIFLSHDWPNGVYNYGNIKQLLKRKPFFREDIEKGELGSKPTEELLSHLMPMYWFSAHLHCKFAALIKHNEERTTRFLALDKCLPKRRFLQVVDIPQKESSKVEISYDLEWLSVLYNTNHLSSVKNVTNFMPGPGGTERYDFTPTEDEKNFILKKFNDNLTIPLNFKKTALGYNSKSPKKKKGLKQPEAKLNPQTVQFCDTLGVSDPIVLLSEMCGLNLVIPEDIVDESMQDITFISDTDISVSINDSQLEMETSSQDSQESAPEKKMGNLSLPEPKNIEEVLISEVKEEDTNVSKLDVSVSEGVTSSPKRSLETVENQESVAESMEEENVDKVEWSPMMKKFKRRNAEMYKTETGN